MTNKRLTIEEMQSLAKDRGGKCLSMRYVNNHTKLKWQCAYGHRWMAQPQSIKNQMQWCPQCSGGVSERICRTYLRQLFGRPFPKARPRWLKNDRGNQMELDGYCKTLRLAFEHHGEQHYKRVPHWESNRKFKAGLRDDVEKQSLCKKNGIRLIVIPELFSMTKLDDLQQFIYDECKRLHVRRPKGMLDKKINVTKAWTGTRTSKSLDELRSIARHQGGRCLSKKYINSITKMEFVCASGHQWMARAGDVKLGSWCTECAGLTKLTLVEMQDLAIHRGGKCLSDRYVNQKTKLHWECEKGHHWKATANMVKRGSWCPVCGLGKGGIKKLSIAQLRALAKERGGRCLSKCYLNSRTKINWQCRKGHRWSASANDVKNNGSWCPTCAGLKKLTIDSMHKLAKDRGGCCLSKKYANVMTKLEWQCAKGHRWKATPNDVKNNESWCPRCSREIVRDKLNLGIEQMQSLAKKRGGRCLSKEYVNTRSKLEWQCAKGHRWKAVPGPIKYRGTWCPKCRGK